MSNRLIFALFVAGLTGGCATTATPPSTAVLGYDRADCGEEADLSAALSLTPSKEKAVHLVSAVVDSTSPCMMTPRGSSPVVLFAVPTDIGDKTFTVGGAVEPLRILSPEVATLDRDGQVVRSFPADQYLYRGTVFSVQFRPRAEEAFIRVSVDPDRVGREYDSIAVGVNYSSVSTPYGAALIGAGTENRSNRTFSYEGSVQVVINDTDVKEDD